MCQLSGKRALWCNYTYWMLDVTSHYHKKIFLKICRFFTNSNIRTWISLRYFSATTQSFFVICEMNLYYLYLAEKMNRHEVFEQTNEANEPLLISNKQERRNQSMPGKILSDTTRRGWGGRKSPMVANTRINRHWGFDAAAFLSHQQEDDGGNSASYRAVKDIAVT